MDGNGFNGQGALDTSLNVAGRGLGAVAALADLWAHRDPYALLGARNQLLQDPGFRDSAGPFLSGLVQIGGSRQPMSLGPGGTGPSAPNRAYMPNFPPLGPETALRQNVAAMTNEELSRATPEQRQQFAQAELGIHPSVQDQIAQVLQQHPGASDIRIGTQGGVGYKLPNAGPTEPVPPGFTQYGGKIYRTAPLAGPAGKPESINTEFKLWQRDNPTGTFGDYQAAKAGAAATKQAQVDAAKAAALTNATKTMVEAAPKVVHFVDRIEKDLDKVSTGPAASRYQEFMAGRIGAPNPDFTRYRTNVGLLTTLLLRMHVGARGGQQMLEHFTGLLNSGVQSPENMRAALDEIRAYAGDVAATPRPGVPAATAGATEAPAEGTQTTPGGNTYRILEQ